MIAGLFIAAGFFFLISMAGTRQKRQRTQAARIGAAVLRDCPYCLTRVPRQASVCAQCGRDIPALPIDTDEAARALRQPPSLRSALIHAPRSTGRWKGLLR